MEKKSIILFFVLGFLIFVLGGGVGVFYQSQKYLSETCSPVTEETSVLEKTVKDLSSQTIFSIIASGTVEDIGDRNITISNNKENLTVKIKEGADISSFVIPAAGETSSNLKASVKFEDIKKGNNLKIFLKVLADGQITGESVIIMY